ncbi:hypothetical protein DL1_11830 [Thioclava dalianensis]|uniref:Uncharacterized protein n=1 Tax=Thioclava dalianensis TaxID=1185766 RepID=A0A074THC3_9RHOB|nr:hypothetical protein DL1_11830 [Thioclava dalianensis]SFN62026.1 hypothetical protein SAMN05216224_10830 [Thioclava dalianensis]
MEQKFSPFTAEDYRLGEMRVRYEEALGQIARLEERLAHEASLSSRLSLRLSLLEVHCFGPNYRHQQ